MGVDHVTVSGGGDEFTFVVINGIGGIGACERVG